MLGAGETNTAQTNLALRATNQSDPRLSERCHFKKQVPSSSGGECLCVGVDRVAGPRRLPEKCFEDENGVQEGQGRDKTIEELLAQTYSVLRQVMRGQAVHWHPLRSDSNQDVDSWPQTEPIT